MSKPEPEDFEIKTYLALNPETGDTHGIASFDGKTLRFGVIANDHLQGFESRAEAEAALKGLGVPGHIVPLVLRPADGSFPPGWPT